MLEMGLRSSFGFGMLLLATSLGLGVVGLVLLGLELIRLILLDLTAIVEISFAVKLLTLLLLPALVAR